MSAAPRDTPRSTFAATLLVARKELVSSFRDRQTTLYTVVLPIALYPFLFWVLIQGALLLQGRRERTEVDLQLVAEAPLEAPAGLSAALTEDPELPGLERIDVRPIESLADEEQVRERVRRPLDPDDAPGRADAVLFLRGPPAAGAADEGGGAELYYDSTSARSGLARARVEERLPAFADRLREERARELAHSAADLEPLRLADPVDVAALHDRGAYLLSFLLPMLLVLMTVMGAFYPAVDLTAGERERRTEETTLLLPVPRQAVHQGKILAVCTTAVLATSLNLMALGLSAGHLLQMASTGRAIEVELPLASFAAILPLALLFALFVSAVLTGIAAFARTFQEGQALLGPVQMVFILPAMAAVIPGIEFTPTLACIPVINVVFAFRALLLGDSMPLSYTLTALSLLLCAAASVWLAMRLLSREPGPEGGWVRKLLGRRPIGGGAA